MKIQICNGMSCSGKFSKYIKTRINNDIKFYKWKNIELVDCPCIGQCKKGVNMMLGKKTFNYVSPSKASELILKEIK